MLPALILFLFWIPISVFGAAKAEVREFETMLKEVKPKTLKHIEEDLDVQTDSSWNDDNFEFFNGVLLDSSLNFAAPLVLDFSIYPKMSSAIKKFVYDPKNKEIEIIGEASGFHMHSWVGVETKKWETVDESSGQREFQAQDLTFRVLQGDMKGMVIKAHLLDYKSKTLVLSRGVWPNGKKVFSSILSTLFLPVSEIVIGVATKNFRSYIKEESKNRKK